MKALQYTGPKKLEFVEIPVPQMGEDDVMLKIKKVGICGTDLHIYGGGMSVPTPLIMGHEFVGDIVEMGANVKNLKVGDRAVAEHVIECGQCVYCKSLKPNLCLTPRVVGVHKPGALAEFLVIPARLVHVLPEGLSYDDGVLVEPLSIAVYAMKKSGAQIGDTVSVVGQGPIGIFVDQVAKSLSCKTYGFDVNQSRLDYVLSNGYVDFAYNTANDSYVDKLRSELNADGTDLVFEAVGREETAQLSLKLARRAGKVMVLGVFEHNVSINVMDIVKKELTVVGSWTSTDAFDETISLIRSGKIATNKLITHRYSFDNAVKAFEDASTYSNNRIKTVIEF